MIRTEGVETLSVNLRSWKLHEGQDLAVIMLSPGKKGAETHRGHGAVVRRRRVCPSSSEVPAEVARKRGQVQSLFLRSSHRA